MSQSICIFCGSSPGKGQKYLDHATSLSKQIAAAGWNLVYGGASIGIMGRIADVFLAEGKEVRGVIPESITKMEIAHTGLTELEHVPGMHERKRRMYDLSDVFLAIPGGLGTLDELFEILTWSQLGEHSKPIYLENSTGFFDHLIQHINQAHKEGFVSAEHVKLCRVIKSEEQLSALLEKGLDS